MGICACDVAPPGSPPASPASPLARLDDSPVSAAQFVTFVESIRGPGYRPATLAEARRLLDALLGQQLLEREQARLGLADLHTTARRLAVQYVSLGPEEFPDVSLRAVASLLLGRAEVHVDGHALARLVEPRGQRGPPGHPLQPAGGRAS